MMDNGWQRYPNDGCQVDHYSERRPYWSGDLAAVVWVVSASRSGSSKGLWALLADRVWCRLAPTLIFRANHKYPTFQWTRRTIWIIPLLSQNILSCNASYLLFTCKLSRIGVLLFFSIRHTYHHYKKYVNALGLYDRVPLHLPFFL